MISTTLITFLFEAPSTTFTVELLGSWDRFTKSYPLTRDRKTGPGHWRGCHTFTNITCDGDSNDMSSKRDGGLKMGGKYWYFYRLDGDAEYHDPVEPSTTCCPFLPGQRVNILEVPVQAVESRPRSGSFSSIECEVYTLDPKAKYLKPQPSARPTTFMSSFTKLENTSVATILEKGRTSTAQLLLTENSSRGLEERDISTSKASSTRKALSSGSATRRLLSAAFAKMRLTRSAGLTAGSEHAGRLHSSRADPRRPEGGTHTPKVGCNSPAQDGSAPVTAINRRDNQSLPQKCDTVVKFAQPVLREKSLNEKLSQPYSCANEETTHGNFTGEPQLSTCATSLEVLEQLQNNNSFLENSPIYARRCRRPTFSANLEAVSGLYTQPRDDRYLIEGTDEEETHLHQEEMLLGTQCYAGSVSSYTTNNIFSPGLASSSAHTGGMSPFHLSQPDTPSISDFGEDVLGGGISIDTNYCDLLGTHGPRDTSKSALNNRAYPGFQEYSLSEFDQASVLTVRKHPNDSLESRGSGTAFGQHDSKELVHSWNDGSAHRMTALEELVDDLGYLGEIII